MRLREHEAVLKAFDIFRVDPRKLVVDPGFNVRDLDAPTAREALDELKEQIRFEGVRDPLEVRLRGEDLVITSGHRRHKVVMELIGEGVEILSVPAIAEPTTVSDADRVAGLVTMNSGLPLTPLEKAEVVRRLFGYGWDREQIRSRLGFKTTQSIADLEALIVLPEPVKEQVRDGTVSATTARNVVRREGPLLAADRISQAKETSGRSRVTPRQVSRPPLPPKAPVNSQAKFEIFIGTLKDIAAQGDARSAKIAGTCLRLQGIAMPEPDPANRSEPEPDEEKRELVTALRSMVEVYQDTDHDDTPLPAEEQPRVVQLALMILNRMTQ